MKRTCFLLLMASILFSCSRTDNGNAVCTINGRYASAPDGMVLYLTPVDDILSPTDSAVVKDGHFSFAFPDSMVSVRFISSQVVVDGGFLVVEPGIVDVDFGGTPFVSGTPLNEQLNRFMAEKEKIVGLKGMASPNFLRQLAVDGTMQDSIKELATFASGVFEAYALKVINENIGTPVGYFCLLQSVGNVAPGKLLPLLDKVPLEYRDKLYDATRERLNSEAENIAVADKYVKDALKSLEATAVGKKYQNFELDNINGGKVLLSDEILANKYTLVFFWAGWDGCAKENLPLLSVAYEKYKEEGLQLVGVSLDRSVADCRAVVDELGICWMQLCNPAGGSAEVAAAYGITELPAAILINNKGTILGRYTTVADAIKKLEELF